jgi:3',5'-cyclic AMP phosphodiesterase CpdA
MSGRFVVLSDTHFLAPGRRMVGKTWWNRVLETRCDEIGAALVAAVRRVNPDFVIHCGDLVGYAHPDNYEFGLRVMDQLSCPWYVAPGNHDAESPGVRTALAARYSLPGEDCYYARDLAGLRFLFLDLAYFTSAGGDVSPYQDRDLHDRGQIRGTGPSAQELAWLEQELAAAEGPVALVSHAPLGYKVAYPMPTLPYGTPAAQPETSIAGLMGDVLQRHTMRAMIGRCRHVKVAFAGHWHISDMVFQEGVAFCQTASLREYPFEFRVVEVSDSVLRVSTLGLGERFQRESAVEAWGNQWIAGTPDSRSFEVRLC